MNNKQLLILDKLDKNQKSGYITSCVVTYAIKICVPNPVIKNYITTKFQYKKDKDFKDKYLDSLIEFLFFMVAAISYVLTKPFLNQKVQEK